MMLTAMASRAAAQPDTNTDTLSLMEHIIDRQLHQIANTLILLLTSILLIIIGYAIYKYLKKNSLANRKTIPRTCKIFLLLHGRYHFVSTRILKILPFAASEIQAINHNTEVEPPIKIGCRTVKLDLTSIQIRLKSSQRFNFKLGRVYEFGILDSYHLNNVINSCGLLRIIAKDTLHEIPLYTYYFKARCPSIDQLNNNVPPTAPEQTDTSIWPRLPFPHELEFINPDNNNIDENINYLVPQQPTGIIKPTSRGALHITSALLGKSKKVTFHNELCQPPPYQSEETRNKDSPNTKRKDYV